MISNFALCNHVKEVFKTNKIVADLASRAWTKKLNVKKTNWHQLMFKTLDKKNQAEVDWHKSFPMTSYRSPVNMQAALKELDDKKDARDERKAEREREKQANVTDPTKNQRMKFN